MQNKYDRWDLSYLYQDFDDEQFKADLASLKEEAKQGTALLQDGSLTRLERLEKAVSSIRARYGFDAIRRGTLINSDYGVGRKYKGRSESERSENGLDGPGKDQD